MLPVVCVGTSYNEWHLRRHSLWPDRITMRKGPYQRFCIARREAQQSATRLAVGLFVFVGGVRSKLPDSRRDAVQVERRLR